MERTRRLGDTEQERTWAVPTPATCVLRPLDQTGNAERVHCDGFSLVDCGLTPMQANDGSAKRWRKDLRTKAEKICSTLAHEPSNCEFALNQGLTHQMDEELYPKVTGP